MLHTGATSVTQLSFLINSMRASIPDDAQVDIDPGPWAQLFRGILIDIQRSLTNDGLASDARIADLIQLQQVILSLGGE